MQESPFYNRQATRTAFRIGLGSYAFRWAVELLGLTAFDLLKASAKMGAEVIQLCDNLPILSYSEVDLADIRIMAGDLGLMLETGIKGATLESIQAGLRAARSMGSPLLRVVLDEKGHTLKTDEAEVQIRSVLPFLEEENIALAVENHFDLKPRELKTLVEVIGHPLVGVCLDPFNSIAHLVGAEETIRLLAPYTLTVHLKDVRAVRQKTGFYVHGCPLGQGSLDLHGMLETLCGAVPEQPPKSSPTRHLSLLLEAWMDRVEGDEETCVQEADWNKSGLETLRILVSGGLL